MALPRPISPSQTDAKSPVNDFLMESFRINEEYLDEQVTGGSTILSWCASGPLSVLRSYKAGIDLAPCASQFTPGICRATILKSGISGNLRFDIRKIAQAMVPILGIDFLYDQATQSIGSVGSVLNTQSITRSASQISTQSVSVVKATINVESVLQVPGTNRWRYNLASLPDADWKVGAHVLISGCTNALNNGTFEIVERNQSGFPSIVIVNASGVQQDLPSGTLQLQLFSFNQTNPVDAEFSPGEKALFASHSNGGNNGSLEIYKINDGGNNILVYNQNGVSQGSPGGTVDVLRFKYNLLTPANATDFAIGERVKAASHTTGANNGNLRITGVNIGGSNVTVYNDAGTVQAGVAGNVATNRWRYALPTDPSGAIQVGEKVQLEGHTNSANNGVFDVVEVRNSSNDNIVIYNESGVAQGGVAGRVRTSKKAVRFASDESARFTTSSFIELSDTVNGKYRFGKSRSPFAILEVNRGGGANYNVIIEAPGYPNQSLPAGMVMTEMRSIFLTPPSISVDLTGTRPNYHMKAFFTDFVPGNIPSGTKLGLFILEMFKGSPEDFSVILQ